ncbi:Jag N-terminal domain-containing protein [Helicobacter burdigaliensis]|uniref:Jag N-terminal domain-containing protein n=1 Tax=Helicobacter burdigaliensis TaxID=2315334 RepID=UPI000EF649C4|nr:Jag N-terminal domain-containing protein [Helicobacter burdigaliensis]
MKKFEAHTLEEALLLASHELSCSVIDLEYEIIQNASNGFLGFGKKKAIICAQSKTNSKDNIAQDMDLEQKNSLKEDTTQEITQSDFSTNKPKYYSQTSLISLIPTIKQELDELLSLLPYSIEIASIEPYDTNTLYIKLDGEDSALLIGKEGYRYKAMSYLIFNWINHVYGLMIRLEIAEFLKNQEDMIANYLLPIKESIKATGKAQTKPLDGVLAHIALKQLREEFPNKYVSFRLNSEGERFVIVNDFYSKP